MQQQFPKVINRIRNQRGNAEVVRTGLGFLWRKGCVEIDAGEVEQGVLVVGAVVAGGLIVGGIDAVEGRVDFGLDAVEGVEDAFRGVEVSAGGRGVGEPELDVRGGDEGVDIGVLGGRLVDFGGEVGEEGEVFVVIWMRGVRVRFFFGSGRTNLSIGLLLRGLGGRASAG